MNSRASGFSVLIIIGFLLELSKTVMSILKQNFFAYYMAVGSIFSCATWQSSCNILEASSRLGAAISETGRQGYFISPIVVAHCSPSQRSAEHLLGLSGLGGGCQPAPGSGSPLQALPGWAPLLKLGVGLTSDPGTARNNYSLCQQGQNSVNDKRNR